MIAGVGINTTINSVIKRARFFLLLLLATGLQAVSVYGEVTVSMDPEITLSSSHVSQGEAVLITVRSKGDDIPQVTWQGKKVYLLPGQDGRTRHGFFGVDLKAQEGRYPVVVRMRPSGMERRISLEVAEKDYGVRRLKLPRRMVDLDAETLERVRRESAALEKVWETVPSEPLWRGGFLKPVPGKVIGPFGRRSIINDQPRAPHSGVDLKGARGTPVKAMTGGQVALTGEFFFGGRTVVIDHGGGLHSMYLHLDEILVREGQGVSKGEAIGRVGSTGRATGPHLHWAARVNGARIDPMQLIALSQELE